MRNVFYKCHFLINLMYRAKKYRAISCSLFIDNSLLLWNNKHITAILMPSKQTSSVFPILNLMRKYFSISEDSSLLFPVDAKMLL